MRQVTRVVIRRPERERPERLRQRGAREELGDVHHLPGEGRRAPGPRRISAEEVSVGLHVRPAPGGVDHDGLELGGLERGDGGARQRAGALGLAGVRVERAAAALGPRDPHLHPLARQAPDGRLVVRAEHRVLDAAVEEAHPPPQRPARRDAARAGRRPAPRGGSGGRSASDAARVAGNSRRSAAGPDEALEPAPLVEAQRARHEPQEAPVAAGARRTRRAAPDAAPGSPAAAPPARRGPPRSGGRRTRPRGTRSRTPGIRGRATRCRAAASESSIRPSASALMR